MDYFSAQTTIRKHIETIKVLQSELSQAHQWRCRGNDLICIA